MNLRFLAILFSILIVSPPIARSSTPPKDNMPAFEIGSRILFQGDSITDGNRGRSADPNHILGHGYAFILAARYGAQMPERHLTFMNRGISGNKVADLLERWQKDTLDLKPDVLSILIGVNDLNGGVTAEEYRKEYGELLDETYKALPNVRIVLCEPFGLPSGGKKENWAEYKKGLAQFRAVVGKLGDKYHIPVVHVQKVLDEAVERAPAEYWIWDGVHPTYSGHELLADEWAQVVGRFWSN